MPFALAVALAALSPAQTLAAPSPAQAPASLPAALAGKLVRIDDGRLASTDLTDSPRLIAFYFGAGWCGPCRAFVPELRAAYPRLLAQRVEVVFVSDDASCGAMRDYMVSARMPWPALDCRSRHRFGWLQRTRGAALPGLLVFDRAGRLLMTSWSATGRSAPRAALTRLMSSLGNVSSRSCAAEDLSHKLSRKQRERRRVSPRREGVGG